METDPYYDSGIDLNIDYKTLYDKVSEELTQARLYILKQRYKSSVMDKVDANSIRKWLQDNYFLIVIAIMLISVLLSLIDSVGKSMKRKGTDNA